MLVSQVWNNQNQNDEKDIFGVIQKFRDTKFSGFNFVQPILNQAKRAEPATGRSTDDQSNRHKKSQQKKWETMDGGKMLQHANRATEDGKGTGVTVEKRHAHSFKRSIVGHFGCNNLVVTICQHQSDDCL